MEQHNISWFSLFVQFCDTITAIQIMQQHCGIGVAELKWFLKWVFIITWEVTSAYHPKLFATYGQLFLFSLICTVYSKSYRIYKQQFFDIYSISILHVIIFIYIHLIKMCLKIISVYVIFEDYIIYIMNIVSLHHSMNNSITS